ncbi:MAG: hypothetical protein NXI16_04470 [Alphaproteobacteria bacterium]|nr:hypothetical protein [Alphaproteobacteria bacterium]
MALFYRLSRLIIYYGVNRNRPDAFHESLPAGYTYFYQFIAHDMTFFKVFDANAADVQVGNTRRNALRLDSVYGSGPAGNRELYQPEGDDSLPRRRLLLGRTRPGFGVSMDQGWDDLARLEVPEGGSGSGGMLFPLIADLRNDENLILSQLTVIFHKAHNRLIDLLDAIEPAIAGDRQAEIERRQRHFSVARELMTHVYHKILVEDGLRRLVEKDAFERHHRRFAAAREAGGMEHRPDRLEHIPFEFALGAFRFGHALVLNNYKLNRRVSRRANFSELVGPARAFDGKSLIPLPADWVIEWPMFFDDQKAAKVKNLTKKIQPASSNRLPSGGENEQEADQRREAGVILKTLKSGYEMGLWDGQKLAAALGVEKQLSQTEITETLCKLKQTLLTWTEYDTAVEPEDQLSDVDVLRLGQDTPLFLYILLEASCRHDGQRLGPLGSEIIARTFFDQLIVSQAPLTEEARKHLNLVEPLIAAPSMKDFIAFSGHGMAGEQPSPNH